MFDGFTWMLLAFISALSVIVMILIFYLNKCHENCKGAAKPGTMKAPYPIPP